MKTADFLQLSKYKQDTIVAKELAGINRLHCPTFMSIERCLRLADERPEVWTLTRTTDKRYKFILYPKPRSDESSAWHKNDSPQLAILVALLKAIGYLED